MIAAAMLSVRDELNQAMKRRFVQQAQGRVQADTQMAGGTPVNTDHGLEAEADAMGARALQTGAAQMRER